MSSLVNMENGSSSSSSTISNNIKAALFEQYHNELLPEFTRNIRENINIRLEAIEDRVNDPRFGLPEYFDRFEIGAIVRNEIMAKIEPEIDEKTKVQHKSCKKKIDSIKDYRCVARNRLNRNKPKFLGNFVFGKIIFIKLYSHIIQQCKLHKLPSIMIMRHFITILISIFESTAQFIQTKPQPIITFKTLVNDNLFKSGCINLLKWYQIPPELYQTDKRKSKKNKSTPITTTTPTIPKEPQKRDKAKMAFQKIVDAIKLINTEQRLLSVEVPQVNDIITNHDTRKNKTYNNTMCITPPSNNNGIHSFIHQTQYIPPHVQQTTLPSITSNISFESATNMIDNTHFIAHSNDAHSNSSSSGDELSASTHSGDRDQNISLSDSGISREYSSSSTSNSLSMQMDIPEHIDGCNYINYQYGNNQYGANNYNHNYNESQQNEFLVGNGQIMTMHDNDNNDVFNGYQPQQIQQIQQSQQQQTEDLTFYENNNNGNMVFNDEYKQMITQSTHNNYIGNNTNNNYSTLNQGINNFNNNVNMNGDNQFGAMLSGANLGINRIDTRSNNYNQLPLSSQYQQRQVPIMNHSSFTNNTNNNLLVETQEQTQQLSQYGHCDNIATQNRMNDNVFVDNTNTTIVSTNMCGFDNNSIANSNIQSFGCFDSNNSVSMNTNIDINNLSSNQSISTQIPIMTDAINSNSINSNCISYGASRGRSTTNNVSSLRYSPLSLPTTTQPMTISNAFSYTSNHSNLNMNTNMNTNMNMNMNGNECQYVPFPY